MELIEHKAKSCQECIFCTHNEFSDQWQCIANYSYALVVNDITKIREDCILKRAIIIVRKDES